MRATPAIATTLMATVAISQAQNTARQMNPAQMTMNDVELTGTLSNGFHQSGDRNSRVDGRALRRKERGQTETRCARVTESPLANNVTSQFRSISASVSQETTLSVPP